MADLIRMFFGPVLLIAMVLLIAVFMVVGRKRTGRDLRDLAPFIKLRRVVGQAVESGSRLHISIGSGSIQGVQGASAMMGLALLERVARAASISDLPPVVTSGDGVLMTLSQNTLRSAYRAMGADDQYDPHAGQLAGVSPLAYAAGAMMVIHDERPSANVLAGHFGSEAALLAEASERSGGVMIAGSDNLSAQAVLYAAAQEPLVGEELYAGGAYLGSGAAHVASLKAQDMIHWILFFALLVAAVSKWAGVW